MSAGPATAAGVTTQVAQTLHGYHNDVDDTYHLSLGPWTMKPPPPTWCEFFVSEGIAHQTGRTRKGSGHNTSLGLGNTTMSRRYWSDLFETGNSPSARAYHFLSKIDVGPDQKSGRGLLLEFHDGDAHPGDNSLWVNVCYRPGSSTSACRLRSWRIPRDAQWSNGGSASADLNLLVDKSRADPL